ncbi:hypothetical protein GIB67_026791 [Kingdonia uniflora]|uniref:KIB1-4 beta-propeller domain-containing protein n=1 Tax=Kingdonia uniflora TaxID=39325 RepID=A0A7J7MHE1_9MAGN|nr:hypothetical protein GIB67_026791 [Kingdonia uniflora]
MEDVEDCDDLTYYNGLLYYLNFIKKVVVICDIRTSLVVQQIHLPDSCGEHCRFYFVGSSEELLLFAGRLCPNSKEIMGFNAFQLDQSSRKRSEVKNLGGQTIFLSKLSSISLLASNHPRTKPNCIYFLPSHVKKHYKVFSLKDDSIEDFPLDAKFYGEYSWQQIWFTPSRCGRDVCKELFLLLYSVKSFVLGFTTYIYPKLPDGMAKCE